jgi:alkylation response protein AidB-like acyl-CoA dehydrogenase
MLAIARNTARNGGNEPAAVIVDPSKEGVHVGDELPRPGVKGISLSTVAFNEYEVAGEEELVGGFDADIGAFIQRFKAGSSLAFAARAVGSATAAVENCQQFLDTRPRDLPGWEVIDYRFAELRTQLMAVRSVLAAAVAGIGEDVNPASRAHMTKVFCSATLQDVVRTATMLKGGAGYADEDKTMGRIFRDAASLVLIDTPNDILLSRVGHRLLEDSRLA